MSKPKSFRACFVPLCTNTTETTPDKVFLNVPLEVKLRNQWFKAVGRENPKTHTRFSCCEDHFDLKEDVKNYLYYKTMGGRIRIKNNVVPHKFTCHSNRNPSSNLKPNHRTLSNLNSNCEKQVSAISNPSAEKRRKQQITQEESYYKVTTKKDTTKRQTRSKAKYFREYRARFKENEMQNAYMFSPLFSTERQKIEVKKRNNLTQATNSGEESINEAINKPTHQQENSPQPSSCEVVKSKPTPLSSSVRARKSRNNKKKKALSIDESLIIDKKEPSQNSLVIYYKHGLIINNSSTLNEQNNIICENYTAPVINNSESSSIMIHEYSAPTNVLVTYNAMPWSKSSDTLDNLNINKKSVAHLTGNNISSNILQNNTNSLLVEPNNTKLFNKLISVKKINCKEKFTNVEEPFTSLGNETENQENINVVCSTSMNKDETNQEESIQVLPIYTKEAMLLFKKRIEDNIDCQRCDSMESIIKPKPLITDVRTISLSSFNAIEEVVAFPSNDRQLSTDYDIKQNENQIFQFPENIICFNCPKISTHVCEVCLEAYYCSKECAASYWIKKHYKYCKPYHIRKSLIP